MGLNFAYYSTLSEEKVLKDFYMCGVKKSLKFQVISHCLGCMCKIKRRLRTYTQHRLFFGLDK